MIFYISVAGVIIEINNPDDTEKLSWDIEPKAVEGICTAIIRMLDWPPLDLHRKRGLGVSTIGFLYNPVEYAKKQIHEIHKKIALGIVRGKSNDDIQAPPSPARTENPGHPDVYIRVLPLFFFGERSLIPQVPRMNLPSSEIATIIKQNLSLEDSTNVYVYNRVIDRTKIDEWVEEVVRNITQERS